MKNKIKISVVMIAAILATGCATKGDLDALSARVDALENRVDSVANDANAAKTSAAAAEAAANRAASYAQETNSKLDAMFRKSMMK